MPARGGWPLSLRPCAGACHARSDADDGSTSSRLRIAGKSQIQSMRPPSAHANPMTTSSVCLRVAFSARLSVRAEKSTVAFFCFFSMERKGSDSQLRADSGAIQIFPADGRESKMAIFCSGTLRDQRQEICRAGHAADLCGRAEHFPFG